MRTTFIILATTAALATTATARADTWDIDPAHSSVTFTVRHLMVSNVRGEFGKISGTISYDEKNPANSSVVAEIDVNTINTRDAKRDGHLKSADFFDVEKYPKMTFSSTKVQVAGKGKLRAFGNLTMHGITKPVVLEITGPTAPVKSPFGTTVVASTATGKVNRKDFNMVWNKALDGGGMLVGDEVNFTIDLEAVKQLPKDEKAAR